MSGKDRIESQLLGMSDEDAIAVLEGRLPAADPPEVRDAAGAIAAGLQREPGLDVASDGVGGPGTAPTRAFPVPPWMRIAAAFALGVLVSTLAPPLRLASDDRGGLATANVVFLENFRSGIAANLVEVIVDQGETHLSLIAYPNFSGVETLTVYLEQSPAPDAVPTEADAAWKVLFVETMPAGTRDSVVVTVPADLLESGIHRIRMVSGSTAAGAVLFRVSSSP